MFTYENVTPIFNKWLDILRLRNNWDIKLVLINDDSFKKTGDFKIDPDDITLKYVINPQLYIGVAKLLKGLQFITRGCNCIKIRNSFHKRTRIVIREICHNFLFLGVK